MQLFTWCGNPFVDNGIAAMLALSGKRAPEELDAHDVEAMREHIMEVFLTEAWLKGEMYNIFPNSVYTNNFKEPRELVVNKFANYFASKVAPLESSGNCICCGRRSALARLEASEATKKSLGFDTTLKKIYIPLSGGSLNFFPSAIPGLQFCGNCVWATLCSPLNFFTANFNNRRFIVLHSNTSKILVAWAKTANDKSNRNLSSGVWNEGHTRINVFFEMIFKIIRNTDFSQDDRYVTVRFYHFDNYNQPKPEPLKIYDLPAPVFFFLDLAARHHAGEWWRLVRRNYYDSGKQIHGALPEAKDQTEESERLRTKPNFVLEKLLRGDSIVRNFFNRKRRVAHVSWEFVALYLKEVLFREDKIMPDARIESIKRVADELGEVIRQKKSRLRDLEAVSNYAELRIRFRQMINERIKQGANEPLFSLDEYADNLFPQGALGWRETHDLILFRLYETLHDFLSPEDVSDEPIADAVPPDPEEAQAASEAANNQTGDDL